MKHFKISKLTSDIQSIKQDFENFHYYTAMQSALKLCADAREVYRDGNISAALMGVIDDIGTNCRKAYEISNMNKTSALRKFDLAISKVNEHNVTENGKQKVK